MNGNFIGAFNKKNKFRESEFLREKYGIEYCFDVGLFNRAVEDVTAILGVKDTYSVQDAYKFFHEFYHAYQIDYRAYYNYCNTDKVCLPDFGKPTILNDCDIEILSEETGKYFSYLTSGEYLGEKPITLVIDINNKALRNRFPEINEIERQIRNAVKKSFDTVRTKDDAFAYYDKYSDYEIETGDIMNNTIIVIGSFDGKTINSMKVLLSSGIEEIEYILEFFRQHTV